MHEDLISLSDRVWGWDADYEPLGKAAWEGVRAHPWTYARGVLGDFWEELSQPLFAGRMAPAAHDGGSAPAAGSAPTVVVRRTRAPGAVRGRADPGRVPERAALDPRPIRSGRCGRHPPNITSSSTTRRSAAHLAENDAKIAELYAAFPDHWWSPWLGLQMDRSSKLYPPPWLWLLVGAIARRLAATAALVGDAHTGPRRSRDAPRDRDGRLGRAGLRRARRRPRSCCSQRWDCSARRGTGATARRARRAAPSSTPFRSSR